MNSITESFRDKRALAREREARKATLRMELAERRAEFQRQTLLQLQDAVADLVRTTGEMHRHDEMAYKLTGQWQQERYGEDLDKQNFLAMQTTAKLMVRVRDTSLREMIHEVRRLSSSQSGLGISREGSKAFLSKMMEITPDVHYRIGKLLRNSTMTKISSLHRNSQCMEDRHAF